MISPLSPLSPLGALAPAVGAAAPTRMSRWSAVLAWAPAALCVATVAVPPLNHDVAAVLNFAERWLGGGRLYGDLIDVNPPLVFLLHVPAAAAGLLGPVGAVTALLLMLVALVAGCAALARRLLPACPPIGAASLGVAVPLMLLAAGYEFGQREHLMVILALPYLALAARRMAGIPAERRWRLAAALLAAVGFALKPHFLAVPLLVEAVVLQTRGRAAFGDAVPWVMAGFWAAYLAAIPWFFPAYLDHVVPLVWAYYLELGGFVWWQVLLTERLGTVVLCLLPLGAAAWAWPGAGALPRVLAAAAVGAVVAAAAQEKGFSYHALPARLFTGLLAVALAAAWLDRAVPPARAVRTAPVAAVVAAWALLGFAWTGGEAPWRQASWGWSRGGALSDLLRREAYGERLLVLSPDIHPIYPALNYARAQSTLRTMNLWLLQGVYASCPADGARYRETWRMPRAEFYVYRTVAEDFSRAPPAAVLVSDEPGVPECGGERFDLIAYFSRHPAFAETFRRYRPAASIEGYRLYRLED